MYSFVVITQIIINFLEIITVISGTVYIIKYRDDELSRYFVYFLWFTVFIEFVFGWLPSGIYYLNLFSFLKDTFFESNFWAYNIYDIVSFSFYMFFFLSLITSKRTRKIGKYVLILFLVISILNLSFSDVFLETNSSLNSTLGTLLLLLYIILYYYDIFQSDRILVFYKSIPFYVSLGALVFHLTVNPIFIYDAYYRKISPDFVQIQRIILTIANIFMYTCFTVGFIVCYRKRSYS